MVTNSKLELKENHADLSQYQQKDMKFLKSLELTLSDLDFPRTIISHIHFNSLKSLTNLSLQIPYYFEMNEDNLKKLNFELSDLVYLSSLSISFNSGYEFSKYIIRKLFTQLKKLKNLRLLFLKFVSCNKFDDFALETLGDCLQDLRTLHTLSLNFLMCPLKNQGFGNLSSKLGKIKKIKTLILRVNGCLNIEEKAREDFYLQLR